MKKQFLNLIIVALIGAPLIAKAQDKIYFSNGNTVEAKILEITPKIVSYTAETNGPIRKVAVKSIKKVLYANGSEEMFGGANHINMKTNELPYERRDKQNEVNYGDNFISISPIFLTDYSTLGFGLSYERNLTKNGIFSFTLPMGLSLKKMDPSVNYNSYNPPSTATYANFVAMPGVKVYPTGNKRRVSWAINPSLFVAYGTYNVINTSIYNYYNQNNKPVFDMGVVILNSLNIMATSKLYMSLEGGLGFRYFDNAKANYYYLQNSGNVSRTPFVNLGFKIGYRF